jgi:hypothetical protein
VSRPPTPVGSYGAIKRTQLPDGTWSARTYIRDTDGELRLVARRGRSRAAERALKTALADRTPPARNGRLVLVRQRHRADATVEISARLRADTTGEWHLGFACVGHVSRQRSHADR